MRTVTISMIVLCLIAGSVSADQKDPAPAQKLRCPVCGMDVAPYADWNAEIEFEDSIRAVFDGPKDMFKYYLDMKKYNPAKSRADVTSISVKDYYSLMSIDARKAWYVIWSDTYGPMGHEPIPFEKKADAEQFLKEHKGKKILKFKHITPKIIWQLDHP